MERMVRRRTETLAAGRLSAEAGSTIEERLTIFATLILKTALVDETIDLVRAAIAEARRFPNLASSVHRLVRERGANEIAQLLGELAEVRRRARRVPPSRRIACRKRRAGSRSWSFSRS